MRLQPRLVKEIDPAQQFHPKFKLTVETPPRRNPTAVLILAPMYGVAYVIIPTEFASLQSVIDASLAPLQRGGRDKFPRELLAFDDVTNELRRLHCQPIGLKSRGTSVTLQGAELPISGDLDFDALSDFLQSTGAASWRGRLADIEPDFDAFAGRFTTWKRRDPEAGGYGQWLNPLGRWDWWELGGRFDGLVSGHPRRPIPPETKAFLTAPEDASFNETATAAYERFHNMAIAGIAYHF